MFSFYVESHEPLGSLKEWLRAGQGQSVDSTVSVFALCKSAVSSVQKKNNYVESFNLSQGRFVIVHLFPDISRK